MNHPTIDPESIVTAAIELIRSGGWESVSARAIARAMHCSTMPIYSAIGSMEKLRMAAARRAGDLLRDELHRPRTGDETLDLAVGYIAFAREEPNLFRFLMPTVRELLELNIRDENRDEFLFHTWVFTHGLADLIASGAVTMSDSQIIRHLGAADGAFLREHQSSNTKEEPRDKRDRER